MTKRAGLVLLGSALFLLLSAAFFSYFLTAHHAEASVSGWLFNDVILSLFPRTNVSVYIFTITYGAIMLYVVFEFRKPHFLSRLMFAYAILLWLRVLTMSLLQLKAPIDIVFLQDPFLNSFIYDGNIDTDLFFSGHAGLLFLLFFLSKKWIFLFLGIVLSVLLMIQRVHYSIDVLAAFPFAYGIAKSSSYVMKRIGG